MRKRRKTPGRLFTTLHTSAFCCNATIDLLLNDCIPNAEKEIAQLWQAEFTAGGMGFTVTQRLLQKDARLIAPGSPVN